MTRRLPTALMPEYRAAARTPDAVTGTAPRPATAPQGSGRRTGAVGNEAASAARNPASSFATGCDPDLPPCESASTGGADAIPADRARASRWRALARALRAARMGPGAGGPDRHTCVPAWWPAVDALLRASHGERVLIKADIPAGLPAVRIAPHDLTRVVLQLVGNAAHAIADRGLGATGRASVADGPRTGEVRLTARVAGKATAVELAVADDGVGMSPSALSRVFEPFRIDRAVRGASGRSLAIVQRLVGAAGGAVRVSSAVGAGTTVTVRLPIRARNNARLEETPAA